MNCCKQYNVAQSGRALLQLVVLGLLLTGSSLANAALISGSMGVGGVFSIDASSDFETTTTLTFDTVVAKSDGLGDLSTILDGQVADSINMDSLTIRPPIAQINVFTIGGFQFDIDTLTVDFAMGSSFLAISGTGTLSGGGFDSTAAVFDFSSQSANTYSLTIAAVPVPAAVWLFGSGLIGLIAVARRQTD